VTCVWALNILFWLRSILCRCPVILMMSLSNVKLWRDTIILIDCECVLIYSVLSILSMWWRDILFCSDCHSRHSLCWNFNSCLIQVWWWNGWYWLTLFLLIYMCFIHSILFRYLLLTIQAIHLCSVYYIVITVFRWCSIFRLTMTNSDKYCVDALHYIGIVQYDDVFLCVSVYSWPC
jgi:hypothetical protein